MPSWRTLLTLCAASAALLGCSPRLCLSGSCPTVGKPEPDEMFKLVRRELARAETATPLIGAHILERLPLFFPRGAAPDCGRELVDQANQTTFAGPKVEFSRMLIARIRAVESVIDNHNELPVKASFLLRLASLDEAGLSDYQFLPGEAGPAPPKSLVRYLALRAFEHSPMFPRLAEVRRFVLERIRTSTDDREQWLLHDSAWRTLAGSLEGRPARVVNDDGPNLLRSWVADARKRLLGPPDPLSLEIVLQRLWPMSAYGVRFGEVEATRELLESVVAARGELPLTRGIPGAARDLAVTARMARHELEHPGEQLDSRPLMPSPARRVYRPDEALRADPAPTHLRDVDVAERFRALDEDLAELRSSTTRCRVLSEQAHWVTPRDADRRFDALIAPVFQGGKIGLSTVSSCRLSAAIGLGAATEDKRVGLVLRLLRAGPDDIADYDGTGDERSSYRVYRRTKTQVPLDAAVELAQNLDWIERHEALRAWLTEHAPHRNLFSRDPNRDMYKAQTWVVLEPAFERLLSFHAAQRTEASREAGRVILSAWIEEVRAILSGSGFSSVAPYEMTTERLFTLGDLAERFGLREQAQTLFDDILGGRLEGNPIDDLRLLRPMITRGAVVGSFLLAYGSPSAPW